MICRRRRNIERATREQTPSVAWAKPFRWYVGPSRSDGMFNVNGEIRVVGITVLHGRFRGYRCHVADFQVKSAIVRALARVLAHP